MTFRLLSLFLGLAAVAAGVFHEQWLPALTAGRPGAQVPGQKEAGAAAYTVEDFRREFPAAVTAARGAAGQGSLADDARLVQWLGNQSGGLTAAGLERFSSVQIPGFKSLRMSAAEGGNLRELSHSLCRMLTEADGAADNRMGVLVRPVPGGGHAVFVLTGDALPELTLAGLNSGSTDTFVSHCPHCRTQAGMRYDKAGCGFTVDCPACGLRCRVLAQDTAGRYHDAWTFLLPSRCPEVPAGTPPLDVMLQLWRSAAGACRYVEDAKPGAVRVDSWQTPGQTLRRGAGDCEDSALLLTDWLLTRGISARMAMGTMEGEGHAWCIARVDGTDYLLESTGRHTDMNLLPVVNPDNGYEPSSLIDRDALYVRARPGEKFDGDYWSPQKWKRLPRPKSAKEVSAKAAAPAKGREP